MKKITQNYTKLTQSQKQKLFLDCFIESHGNITKACEKANITRKTFYNWREKRSFKAKLESAVEHHNDKVTEIILDMALKGDKDLLKFWAKTQMQHRGFTELHRLEHTGSVEKPLQVNINIPKEVKEELEKDATQH